MAKDDLKPDLLGLLPWNEDRATDSLISVYEHVTKQTIRAVGWYIDGKNAKRKWARRLRVAGILGVGLAGALPIISQVSEQNGDPVIDPAWASIALVAAATIVALDHFFGFSSGWVRYVRAELRIQQMLNEFQMDWQMARASLSQQNPKSEDVQHLLQLAKAFVVEVGAIIQNEATDWAAEFQRTVTRLDEATKSTTGSH